MVDECVLVLYQIALFNLCSRSIRLLYLFY